MSMKQNDETQERWYMVNKDGMATLCADHADAEQVAKDAQEVWPHMGPHRAVRLVEVGDAGFTAADMATAEARGFREGQAAQAAVAAGWQPIATAPKSPANGDSVDGIYLLGFCPEPDACNLQSYICIVWWEPLMRGGKGMWYGEGSHEVHPTHWMPLPPAPSTEGESNE